MSKQLILIIMIRLIENRYILTRTSVTLDRDIATKQKHKVFNEQEITREYKIILRDDG